MNIPKYSLENRKVIYFFLAILLIGGVISFFKLPKKEDAPFVIKTAVLVTQYPGANPHEVEKLITEPIEREIQSMTDVYQIKSESYFGLSKISIELQPTIDPDYMPVKWDELRRKVANIQPKLPSGASTITVNDDFGDVYGIYYALTADEGFSYTDLRDWAQRIRTQLTPIEGVQKVMLYGEQTEVINVKISTSKLSALGIDPTSIMGILQKQNIQVNTGDIATEIYQLRLRTEGTYTSLEDIENQLIISKDGREARLGDIATVERGYYDPPSTLMRVNGKRAIGIGVASGAKDNVVAVGKAVDERLAEIEQLLPIGIELASLYPEDKIADEANNGFILNLIESLVIVILIIFVVMGSRAGMLIGSSLLFSVGGTLLIMLMWGVGLNRTSLAAFIIAMGMLVDNAIVVTDNAQIGIKRGKSRYQSLIEGAIKPQWALLGATFIAICSFLPLYLAPASVAEIVKPLFVVLAVSLGLSWILALCQTTTFGNFILKEAVPGGAMKDPYDTKLYHKFEKFLTLLIKRRFVTLTTVFVTLVLSLVIMAVMPQSFFPKMNKPYFRADLVFPEGFSIHAVDQDVMKVEDYLKNHEKVKSYSVTLGGTPLRYYLASSSFGPKSNYANVMVETKDPEDAAEVEQQFYEHMTQNFPNIITRSALFALSPVPEAAIEIGFIGENPDTLTALVERAKKIARQCDMVTDIRSNWGDKVPVWKPMFSQQKGLRLGITRQQVANSFRTATNGLPLGEYREGDVSLPILLKDEDVEKMNLNDVKSVPVFSTKGNSVKVEQVIDNFALGYDYNVVRRFNRERCMMMQCEPKRGANTMAAFKQVLTAVQEQMQLPEGYKMKYFGEQETQDVSNAALAKNIPLTFLLIYVVLLFLFPSNYRKPVLIMLMLPLVFIGVVWGLLLFGKSLDFFAILGLLGLIGMSRQIMKTKMIYIIGMACMTGTLSAQTVVDYSTFEQKVLDYSQTLKQSVAQRTAMQKAMKAAKTAFFPAVDATGSYQYRINKYEMDFGGMAVPMEHDSYSAEVGVSQPIYAGGSIYHNYKASQIQTQMADKSVDLTTDNIIYAAEASYWGTAAQKEMYETMCQYVQIIEQLTKVLQDKYDDGYISKTDLIQMQTRLKEAELQRSSSYQSYQVALQNMNVLMGLEPLAEMDLTDSISTILPMPAFVGAETALNVRPDYAISQLDVDYQKRQVSLAAAKYNPSLSIGFKETWGTQMLNISGETMFNSNVYASIKLPIFHWGARFKSTAAQKAILLSKQYALQDKQDQISKEVAKAWTSLTENTRQISIAEENCKLAEENLDLNTFSYTEGKLTILDVLSAQLTWIQAYTNLIQSYYEQKIALADYRKATGIRYLGQK